MPQNVPCLNAVADYYLIYCRRSKTSIMQYTRFVVILWLYFLLCLIRETIGVKFTTIAVGTGCLLVMHG
jgi:hypothetical protein